ncbi:MAG: hypothetical protein KGJ88_12815 [Verrucomicrobiota bacterium]|nr:hypothetical protein [Verrucomicrobiota bacterium]
MNKIALSAAFAPDVRFDARPNPFLAARENEFERLKTALLAQRLQTARAGWNAPLRRAANDAAAIAWATVYPLLVFPLLFDEKADAAVRQAERQARLLRNSRAMAGLEAVGVGTG